MWACGTLPNKTIEYRFVRGGRHASNLEDLTIEYVGMWYSAEQND